MTSLLCREQPLKNAIPRAVASYFQPGKRLPDNLPQSDVYGHSVSPGLSHRLVKSRLEPDLCAAQRLGDNAGRLGQLDLLKKLMPIDSRNLRFRVELNRSDSVWVTTLVQVNRRGRVDPLWRKACLDQPQRERH